MEAEKAEFIITAMIVVSIIYSFLLIKYIDIYMEWLRRKKRIIYNINKINSLLSKIDEKSSLRND